MKHNSLLFHNLAIELPGISLDLTNAGIHDITDTHKSAQHLRLGAGDVTESPCRYPRYRNRVPGSLRAATR